MRKNSFAFLLIFFVSIFSGNAFAGNCSYNDAIIYFSSPSVTLSSYNPEYYCSDILYLIKNKKGNMSLDAYKKLYPQKLHSNVKYLRSLGLTPDIIEEEIEDFDYDFLLTKETTDTYLKNLIANYRSGDNIFVVTDNSIEPDPELFQYNAQGDIVNSEKNYKTCIKVKDSNPTESSLYSSENVGYNQIINAIPPALRPIVVSGGKLQNIFDMDVATIDNNPALGKRKFGAITPMNGPRSFRFVDFSNDIFEKNNSTSIEWIDKVCKPSSLEDKVKRNSTCFLCPYIVMIFDEVSYIFDYMYKTFKYTMLIFLIVFGSLFIVFEFLKGFSSLPFTADFSGYPKTIAKKLQAILIVVTIIWIPPRNLFSWTIQPVLDLTIYISDTIMEVGNKSGNQYKCNGDTIVDEINQKRIEEHKEFQVPPVVKQKQLANIQLIEDASILSKTTMGNIICFLNNTLEANGKQMTMGEILVTKAFSFSKHPEYEYRFLGFIFGVIVFGLYFLISIMISFYILDGLLEFFKIAIMWPFFVFGYAFQYTKFNVKSIIGTAKSFGLTLINIAVFSVFNSALLNSFYFVGTRENLLTILNEAIKKDDVSIILKNVPSDPLAITQFLFIVFCIYYIYSKLGVLASSYGGSMGGISIGNNIRNIVNSSRSAITSVTRKLDDKARKFSKKSNEEDEIPQPEQPKQEENDKANEEETTNA